MSFPALRQLLTQTPSEEAWLELQALFESWNESKLQTALEYTNQHIKEWPNTLRDIDVAALKSNKSLPAWFPLIRKLTCRSNLGAFFKFLHRKHKELQNITCISLQNLGYNGNIPKKAEAIAHLSGLCSLEVSGSYPARLAMTLLNLLKVHTFVLDNKHYSDPQSYRLPALIQHPTLRNLTLLGFPSSFQLHKLSSIPHLEQLRLAGMFENNSQDRFQSFEDLRELCLHSYDDDGLHSQIIYPRNLRKLSIQNSALPTQIFLLKRLKTLELSYCGALE